MRFGRLFAGLQLAIEFEPASLARCQRPAFERPRGTSLLVERSHGVEPLELCKLLWKDNDLANQNVGTSSVFPIGGIRSQGWLVGGHAGYNWQYTSVVAGVEIDGTATGISGQSQRGVLQFTPLASEAITLSDNVKYLGTVRGRLDLSSLNIDEIHLPSYSC